MTTFDARDMENFTNYFGITVNTKHVSAGQEKYFITQVGTDIRNGNISVLSDRYVPIVTLIEKADKLDSSVKQGIIDIIVNSLDYLKHELSSVTNVSDLTPDQQKQFQLEIGVVLWMTYKALDEFSFLSRDPNAFLPTATKGRKGTKKTEVPSGISENRFWVKGREKIMASLKPIVQKNLSTLWYGNRSLSDTKIFWTLVLLGLINTLKFGSRDFVHSHDLTDLLLCNFDGLIKNYDREDQLIEHLMLNVLESEDMSKAVAMILTGLRQQHSNSNVIRKGMKRAFDIIRQPENEDKCEKGFTPFLLEIGTNFPEEIKQHSLPFVLTFMESDNSTLRSVVIPIAVEILTWNYKEIEDKKTTKEQSVILREELLNVLFTMMRDANSQIRNRALQSTTSLFSNSRKGIYPEEAVMFVEEAAERILDCAVTTRKNAFTLVREILSTYAIVSKYSPEQIRTKVLRERRSFIARKLEGVQDVQIRLRLVIREFTEQIAKSKMGIAILAQPNPPELENADSAMEHIRTLLLNGSLWEACEMFYRCVCNFADTGIFSGFKNHTYDLYQLYFSKELGITVAEEEEIPNGLDSEVFEGANTELTRAFIMELSAYEVMSEVLANAIIPHCLLLLERGTSTDQSEALLLFSTLVTCEYPLPQSILASILRIVSTADRKTISNMLEPFNAIFFAKEDCRSDLAFVNALIRLVENLGPDLRSNVNALIEEMLLQKKLHVSGIKILWNYVALRQEGAGELEAKQALYILGVCAEAQKQSVSAIYNNLVEETLGERGKADMELAALGLKAISSYLLQRDKSEQDNNCIKLEPDDNLFKKILELIEYGLHPATRDRVNRYYAQVIERGISIIYKCCLAPAEILAAFYEKCYSLVFFDYQNPPMINGVNGHANATTSSHSESTSSQSQSQIYQYEIPESLLYKFIIFAGALVGSHSSFHGTHIMKELKRRKTLARIEDSNAKKCVKEKVRKSFMARANDSSASFAQTPSRSDSSTTEVDELEAVIGQIGYDKEQEQVRRFMEGLLDSGAIKFCWQFAQDVCRNYNYLSTLKVKIAIIRLFGKCMLVGTKALQNGLRTFLKLWETVPSSEEKVELILATLLLNEQYPGQLDQCNALVIRELRSEHLLVRQTALDFITYLTLMDILKLRDILPETIICLADESHAMRDITKQFLRLCYEKDTMLHSVIPDLVIRCSARKDINVESYRTIMKSLLGTLKKVTETTGIAEKLLDRFGGLKIQRGREVQDNAFCLSVLPFNERMFKKIRESLLTYGKYLDDKLVFESFVTILQSAREAAKPELKEKLDEYEDKLLEARNSAVELKKMERRKNGEKSDSEEEDEEKSVSKTQDNEKSDSKTEDEENSDSEAEDVEKSDSEVEDEQKSVSEAEKSGSEAEDQDEEKSGSEAEDEEKSGSEAEDEEKSGSEVEDEEKSGSEAEDEEKSGSEAQDEEISDSEDEDKENMDL